MSICKFILLNSSLRKTTLHETNLHFIILFSIIGCVHIVCITVKPKSINELGPRQYKYEY